MMKLNKIEEIIKLIDGEFDLKLLSFELDIPIRKE